MRAVLLLVLVAVAAAQFQFRRPSQRRPPPPPQFFRNPGFNRRPSQRQPPPPRFRPAPQGTRNLGGGGGGVGSGDVDATNGGSEYNFSWRHDGGRKYSQSGAVGYCRDLGGSWKAISIEDSGENSFVTGVIRSNNLEYIWTGATRSGSSWRWPSGGRFQGLAWSHTGGARRAQPDNREGNEHCLAILNDFYQDGVKWHDVACHHVKPVICERPASRG